MLKSGVRKLDRIVWVQGNGVLYECGIQMR